MIGRQMLNSIGEVIATVESRPEYDTPFRHDLKGQWWWADGRWERLMLEHCQCTIRDPGSEPKVVRSEEYEFRKAGERLEYRRPGWEHWYSLEPGGPGHAALMLSQEKFK